MALRRLAQANNANNNANNSAAPSPMTSSAVGSPATSPVLPTTPNSRVSLSLYRSPASTPSISSSIPFDWDAARSRKPPPYPTPLQNKRKSNGIGSSTPVKRAVVRKKGIIQRYSVLHLHHASKELKFLSGSLLSLLLSRLKLLFFLTMSHYHHPRHQPKF
jgi:hypothetical protein